MNILLFYQNSHRTVFLESLVQDFLAKGHTVFFHTTSEKGIIHDKMESLGAICSSKHYSTSKLFYFQHAAFLIRFCKRNNIDVVYSHLQISNFISLLAQNFIKAKVFPCRHHSDDEQIRGNKNGLRLDAFVNRFSRKLIVVSDAVKTHMLLREKIKPTKIKVIPLGYNFSLYEPIDKAQVANIRAQLDCQLILIVIGRMTANKRHIDALCVLKKLIDNNCNVKMLILDNGVEKPNLEKYIQENRLENRIIFTGFLNNIMNHLAASDILVHPSISEASNQVVKEAGVLEIPSIVCANIGDFDEYIKHKENGFVVSKANVQEEMFKILYEIYNDKSILPTLGQAIKTEVKNRFAIDKISNEYLNLVTQ